MSNWGATDNREMQSLSADSLWCAAQVRKTAYPLAQQQQLSHGR